MDTPFEDLDVEITANRQLWQNDPEYHRRLLVQFMAIRGPGQQPSCTEFLPKGSEVLIDPRNTEHTGAFHRLTMQGQTYVKKFRMQATTHELVFRNLEDPNDLSSLEERIESVFDETLATVFNQDGVGEQDRVGLEIKYEELSQGPILVPFCLRRELTGSKVMSLIQRVLNSNQSISLHKPLQIRVVHVSNPTGGGKRRAMVHRADINKQADHYNHKSGPKRLRRVCAGDDDLCLPKAIILYRARRQSTQAYNTLMHNLNDLVQQSVALLRSANITHAGPCNLNDIMMIQSSIGEKLVVFDRATKYGTIFVGDPPEALPEHGNNPHNNVIALEFHKNHYSWLWSIESYLRCGYFCITCRVKFSNRERHLCGATQCHLCFRPKLECPGVTNHAWVQCEDCLRSFPNSDCWVAHKKHKNKQNKSACQLRKLCRKCGMVKRKHHKCYHRWCATCKSQQPIDGHACFVARWKPEDRQKKTTGEIAWPPVSDQKYIFFDFETAVGQDGRLVVVIAVAQVACDHCRARWGSERCDNCDELPERTWSGLNTLGVFCDWLLADEHAGAIGFAHNGKGFDFNFVARYLIEQGIPFTIVPKGLNIMQLVSCDVRLLCSLNFMPAPLSKLPKMFGFDHESVKGEFPFRALTLANLGDNSAGSWPPLEAFDAVYRRPSEYSKLVAWYDTVKDTPFRLWDEACKYCKGDVTVLRKACFKFNDIMRETLFIEPFEKCCTLPSAVLMGFRHSFLRERVMQTIPELGFGGHRQNSVKAQKYFCWRKMRNPHEKMITALSAKGEHKLKCGSKTYWVDGVVVDDFGTVIEVVEFHGCLYHACISCYPNKRFERHLDGQSSYDDVFQRSTARICAIKKSHPFLHVSIIWEHEFDLIMRGDPVTCKIIDSCEFIGPLMPRDGFYGGRTEVMAMRKDYPDHDIEYGSYLDFCSLYPYINKTAEYPSGACVVLEGWQVEVNTLAGYQQISQFGLIKITVLATRRLRHGVLPVRVRGRLMFPLCVLCAEEDSALCVHSIHERRITGTWPTPEVNLALSHGYEIVRSDDDDQFCIHGMYHWPDTEQYDPVTKTGGLFAEYVNKFVKMKAESSDFPPGVSTDAAKQQYVDNFFQHEGVQLEPLNITKNEPARQIAKFCLNSLWGKFGQAADTTNMAYVTDAAEFLSIFFDIENQVQAVSRISADCVLVQYKRTRDYIKPVKTQALMHAILTSSYGRIQLYHLLEQLGDKVLYCDTDSVIYSHLPNWSGNPPTGPYLGDLTNELNCGEKISSFVATAGKSYSMHIVNVDQGSERFDTKIKGFTLDVEAKKKLNHESMVALVENRDVNVTKIDTSRPGLVRSKFRFITEVSKKKRFSVTSGKRIVRSDFTCVPFGYNNADLL